MKEIKQQNKKKKTKTKTNKEKKEYILSYQNILSFKTSPQVDNNCWSDLKLKDSAHGDSSSVQKLI